MYFSLADNKCINHNVISDLIDSIPVSKDFQRYINLMNETRGEMSG